MSRVEKERMSRVKNCENCDSELPRNARAGKKYCSDNCRKAASSKRNKEGRKEVNKRYYEKRKESDK